MEMMSRMPDIASWRSDGLDWSHPDPFRAGYWVAIQSALIERASAIDYPFRGAFVGISPYRPFTSEICGWIANELADLSPYYYEKPPPHLPPSPLSWSKLVMADLRLARTPSAGLTAEAGADFLLAAKGALAKMQMCKELRLVGSRLSRDGFQPGTSVQGAVGNAISQARGGLASTPWNSADDLYERTYFFAESYTAVQKEASPGGDYMGYAHTESYRIEAAPLSEDGLNFDLYFSIDSSPPTIFEEGDYWEFSAPRPVEPGHSSWEVPGSGRVDFEMGHNNWLPHIMTDQSSPGHRAISGFKARFDVFLNYAVQDGWRFL